MRQINTYKNVAFDMWSANKKMHVNLPALASFRIIARHNGLGGGFGLVLPHTARAGRTCEALGNSIIE
jgi:hypothetical protein